MLIEVADDGVGMGDRPNTGIRRDGAGIGMKNVQERLEVLYGQQATFTVVSNPGRGTSVTSSKPTLKSMGGRSPSHSAAVCSPPFGVAVSLAKRSSSPPSSPCSGHPSAKRL